MEVTDATICRTFTELVSVGTIPGDPDELGTHVEWIKIIVNNKISKQD